VSAPRATVPVILRRAGLAAAIGVALASGYFLRGVLQPRQSAAAAASSSADLDELRSRVAGLEHAVAARQDGYAAFARGAAASRAEPPSTSDPPPPDRAPPERLSKEEQRELDARREQRFESLLRSEPRDRSWAPEYEASLRDAVHATAQGDEAPTIDRLTCGTSLCRLEMTHSSLATQERFMSHFHDQLPPMAAVHFTSALQADGPSKMTLDFVRAGYPTAPIDGPVD
jgi:hypothetical protein